MANDKGTKKKRLTLKEELFCQVYSTNEEFFGNGVKSYIKAYQEKGKRKISYNSAKVNASKLLTNTNILDRINELVDITMNEAMADKQLSKVMVQDADFHAKVGAIKEFNRLKKRVSEQSNSVNIFLNEEHKKNIDSLLGRNR